VLGQIGSGFEVLSTEAFSAMLLALLVGGAVYIVASLAQGGASFQTESVRTESGRAGVESPVLRTLYALVLAVLVAAFVGLGIETFYPAPQSPEDVAPSQEVPPPPLPPPTEEDTPPGVEPPPRFPGEVPPGAQSPIEAYEQELDYHAQVASVVAIVVALLILVAGLIFGFSRLPIINDGVTLGGVLTLLYGMVLAIRAPSGLIGFIVVAVGLIVLLAVLYRQSRRTGRTAGS
jgi:hypothetical protein